MMLQHARHATLDCRLQMHRFVGPRLVSPRHVVRASVGLVVAGVVNLVENRRVDISGRILPRAPQAAIIDISRQQFRRLQVFQCRPRLLGNLLRHPDVFSHTLRKCKRCRESLIVLCLRVVRGPILQCPSSTEVSATSLFLCGRDFATLLYSTSTLPLSSTSSAFKTRSSNAASLCHFFSLATAVFLEIPGTRPLHDPPKC